MADKQPIVYVVDDDAALRRSMQWLVESIGLAVETLPTAQTFLERFDPARPCCLVLDLRMPGMGGLELQEHLAAQGIEIPIIMVTAHGEVPAAVRAMRAGAIDFVEKPFSGQALLERVQEALARAVERHRTRATQAQLSARLRSLTRRQAEVMRCVVDGLANKQIAARLGLSEKTVEVHRARVMRKLGARTVAELVRIAMGAADVGGFPTPSPEKP